MKIELTYHSNLLEKILFKQDKLKLTKAFNNFLAKENKELNKITQEAVLELNFVSDREIRQINKVRRNKDKATDVLSWDMYIRDIKDNPIFGEIYISDDYITKQAKEKGVSLREEVLLMITHGFLHICGFTHENDKDEKEMNQKTMYLLREIGIDYSESLI